MAYGAFARLQSVLPDGATGRQVVTLEVGYVGPENEIAGGADLRSVEVTLLPDDSATNIRTKFTQAVLADAQARGYVLAAKDTTIPVVQKATP